MDYISGQDILFTITPETGWKVASFSVDKEDYTDQLVDEEGELTYTMTAISQDHKVIVDFQTASSVNRTPVKKMKVYPVPAEQSDRAGL